jgi:hypothetical protein
METPIGNALREWFVTTGIETLRPEFAEMLGISKKTVKRLRKEAKQYKAATLIQRAWRKHAATYICKQTIDCKCMVCETCRLYDEFLDCPFCGDTCKEVRASGYCSEQCEADAMRLSDFNRGSRWEEQDVCCICGDGCDPDDFGGMHFCSRSCMIALAQ